MTGVYTFTTESTTEIVVNGILRHAYLIVALVGLAGLLFGPRILASDENSSTDKERSS